MGFFSESSSLELTQTSLAAPLGGRTFVESPCPIHEKYRCFVLRTLLLCRVFFNKKSPDLHKYTLVVERVGRIEINLVVAVVVTPFGGWWFASHQFYVPIHIGNV